MIKATTPKDKVSRVFVNSKILAAGMSVDSLIPSDMFSPVKGCRPSDSLTGEHS